MNSDPTQDRLKELLSESLIHICQNEVDFSQLLAVEANVKIICDQDKVIAFNVNKVIGKNTELDEFNPPPKKKFALVSHVIRMNKYISH